MAAESASASDPGELSPTYASELGFTPEECESSGPTADPRRVAENATSFEQVSKSVQADADLNILRRCEASLRPAAPGVRCWELFRNPTNRPHYPPSGEGVLAWSSFFATGRSRQICVAHLKRACVLLGLSPAWKTKSVISGGRGLAKRGVNLSPQYQLFLGDS